MTGTTRFHPKHAGTRASGALAPLRAEPLEASLAAERALGEPARAAAKGLLPIALPSRSAVRLADLAREGRSAARIAADHRARAKGARDGKLPAEVSAPGEAEARRRPAELPDDIDSTAERTPHLAALLAREVGESGAKA